MQLPGYLKGRALQEWRLLPRSEQQSYPTAVEALRTRLDPGSKTVAAQEFQHSLQKSGESVSDFIRRLEKKYQIAYGRDDLNAATPDALLYGQLHEGLRYEIMLSPVVSGSQGYKELATAAKAEELRLTVLKQRQRYSKTPSGRNYFHAPVHYSSKPICPSNIREEYPTLSKGQKMLQLRKAWAHCSEVSQDQERKYRSTSYPSSH